MDYREAPPFVCPCEATARRYAFAFQAHTVTVSRRMSRRIMYMYGYTHCPRDNARPHGPCTGSGSPRVEGADVGREGSLRGQAQAMPLNGAQRASHSFFLVLHGTRKPELTYFCAWSLPIHIH